MKIILTTIILTLTVAVQAQIAVIDTAQLVAVYNYQCLTEDSEGKAMTDCAQTVVQIGKYVTKSMPFSSYRRIGVRNSAEYAAENQEAVMHIPTVWRNWPEGQTTVHEWIFPNEFEGYEPTPDIAWMLLDDTLSVGGYHCQLATTMFRGVKWNVCYTEDVPLSAGPWKLYGLPGLIVKAESKAHTFCLAELRQETTPIIFERKPDVQKSTYEKLLKYRNKIYGDRRYAKNPTYYVPDIHKSIKNMSVLNDGGRQIIIANGLPLLTKAHVYQPLELK